MPRYGNILVALIVLLTTNVPRLVISTPATPGGTPPVRVSASPAAKIDLTWPTTKQVQAGLELRDDSDRSLTEVVASFDDPATVRNQFMAWGWQRNHVRSFGAPAGHFRAQNKIDRVYTSVHVFDSPRAPPSRLTRCSGFSYPTTDSRKYHLIHWEIAHGHFMARSPMGTRSRSMCSRAICSFV